MGTGVALETSPKLEFPTDSALGAASAVVEVGLSSSAAGN